MVYVSQSEKSLIDSLRGSPTKRFNISLVKCGYLIIRINLVYHKWTINIDMKNIVMFGVYFFSLFQINVFPTFNIGAKKSRRNYSLYVDNNTCYDYSARNII